MTDTPDHIRKLQLELWLAKTAGERLYQAIMDNDAMLKALREAKVKANLPLGDLDFVGEYLKKKAETDAAKMVISGENVPACYPQQIVGTGATKAQSGELS